LIDRGIDPIIIDRHACKRIVHVPGE
jgi:hypothetical protein